MRACIIIFTVVATIFAITALVYVAAEYISSRSGKSNKQNEAGEDPETTPTEGEGK